MPAARKRSALPVIVLRVADQALRMSRAVSPWAVSPVILQRSAFWYAAWMSL
jgi:hypothetical protein